MKSMMPPTDGVRTRIFFSSRGSFREFSAVSLCGVFSNCAIFFCSARAIVRSNRRFGFGGTFLV